MKKARQMNLMLQKVDLSAKLCPDCLMRLITYEMDKYRSAQDTTGERPAICMSWVGKSKYSLNISPSDVRPSYDEYVESTYPFNQLNQSFPLHQPCE